MVVLSLPTTLCLNVLIRCFFVLLPYTSRPYRLFLRWVVSFFFFVLFFNTYTGSCHFIIDVRQLILAIVEDWPP